MSRRKLVLSLCTVTHLYTCNKKQPSPRWLVREPYIITIPVITTTFMHMCIHSLDPSPPAKEATTTWLSCSCGGVWSCSHHFTCDIVVGPSCHIYEAKEFLHILDIPLEKQWSSSRMYSLNVCPLQRHIFWICRSVYPFKDIVFAPPARRECVSIRSRGIPRSWG